jgi:predicted alpha/beta-fold hydrolase
MPLISNSGYVRPFYLFNGHLETVIPSAFRKIEGVSYRRERLELADGDFLDLDWLRNKSSRLVIISHGLEGSSDRHYVRGMAKYFFERGWDALAWNCRSCSGEMNRLPRFYHHGATEDLKSVVDHVGSAEYESIALVGISMGGSLSLKYAGEHEAFPAKVKAIATFSVPCHLGSSARELDRRAKKFYLERFLKKLGKKIQMKAAMFPEIISDSGFEKIRSFAEFDNKYTAPLHGFHDASDFYERASSLSFLPHIKIPSLIVNALNDPFLPRECFPYEIARRSPFVFLETPRYGGHTGFTLAGRKENWMEVRAFEFVNSVLAGTSHLNS